MVNVFKNKKYIEDIESLHLAKQNQLQKGHVVVSKEVRKKFLAIIVAKVAIACVCCMLPILFVKLDETQEGIIFRYWVYLGFLTVIIMFCIIRYRYVLFGVKEVYIMQAYYCYQTQCNRGVDKHVFCYYDFVQGRYRFQELSNTHMAKIAPFSACEGLLLNVVAVRSKRQVKLLYFEKIHNSKL